jgi:hypothetical protein
MSARLISALCYSAPPSAENAEEIADPQDKSSGGQGSFGQSQRGGLGPPREGIEFRFPRMATIQRSHAPRYKPQPRYNQPRYVESHPNPRYGPIPDADLARQIEELKKQNAELKNQLYEKENFMTT